MSRPRAYQMIEAASVVTNLSTTVDIPSTERQARPLATLEPEQQREAWKRAVETAPISRQLKCAIIPVIHLLSGYTGHENPGIFLPVPNPSSTPPHQHQRTPTGGGVG